MSETSTRNTRTRADGPQRGSRCYLLFAGSLQGPRGGLADLVQTFNSAADARNAFREIRLKDGSPATWAQLAVVDGATGMQPLCWFGIGATPNRSSTRALHPEAVGSDGTARTARQRSSRFQLRRTA